MIYFLVGNFENPFRLIDSDLDPFTEKLVLDTLFDLMHEKSSLLITHRLLVLEKMAEILVIERGCIVEGGTELELLNHNGFYRRLFELQIRILAET